MTENQMQALLAACDADPQLTAAINEAATVDALIAVAAEHGFTIVPEDLVAPSGEPDLSDNDLEQASGGTLDFVRVTLGDECKPRTIGCTVPLSLC